MAVSNWYVSSTAWTNITPWGTAPFAASATVTLGQITRQSAPTAGNERAFRVTTAGTLGTLEPTWTLTDSGTTNESGHGGTAVWTECGAQEAHQHDNGVTNTWTAPVARVSALNNLGIVNAGDTVFFSSDHSEIQTASNMNLNLGSNTLPVRFISVDRTKSVPPVVADPNPVSGASIANTAGAVNLGNNLEVWGLTVASANAVNFGPTMRFRNGTIKLTAANVPFGFNSAGVIDLENVTLNFNAANQALKLQGGSGGILRWRNTSTQAAVSGTIPTSLFATNTGGQAGTVVILDGLDLSSLGSATVISSGASPGMRMFLTNCKLGSGYVWQNTQTTGASGPTTEFVNCDSGNTNYTNMKLDGYNSKLSTDLTVTMTGGATDGVNPYSHKLVSTSTSTGVPFESFPILKWNSTTGAAVTAAIQVLATATLKMSDIWMEAEYLPDSTDTAGSFVTTQANLLDTTTPLSAGTGVWNNSPASPVTLQMSVTVTPNQVGWVRAFVRLAKTSTTVWINPAFG